MVNDQDIFTSLLKKHEKRVITYRRDLHKIPEPGFEEYKTSAYIARALKRMNIPFQDGIAETGIIAEITGKNSGPTVLLRADIDGIDVARESTGLPFSSRHEGMMHACGHDAHTAMLLCAGSILFKVRSKLQGNVILVFQPAEEGKAGGKEVVDSGTIDFSKVAVAVAQHIWGLIPAGTLGYVDGAAFARPDKFTAVIKGKGGHGCSPHLTVDPVTAAAHVINAVNTIISRKIASSQRAVISFGAINGGSVYNVIPDEVTIKGTVRTYKRSVRSRIKRELKHTVIQAARSTGADASFTYKPGYPVLRNNTTVVRTGVKVAKGIFGSGNVKELTPSMGGEDFSYYLKHVPGAMFFLGGSKGKQHTIHHNACFDIDESALIKGVEFFCRIALEYLS